MWSPADDVRLAATALAVFVTVPQQLSDVRRSDPGSVSVSADGRFVAFVSCARLVTADTNDRADIYVLDRDSGGVTLETADTPIVATGTPVISATGRLLVYEAPAEWDPARIQILMLRDRMAGVTRALHRPGEKPNGFSRGASISGDGRYVAFTSSATNLMEGPDANGEADDVYVMDVATMSCRRIGTGPSGTQAAAGASFAPSLSGDGRFVAFSSTGPSDSAAAAQRTRFVNTYLRDLQTGATTRLSVGQAGEAANGSSYNAAISADGRYVAFVSEATNLVRRKDKTRGPDVYLRDLAANVTILVSRTPSGEAGNARSGHPALSADGRVVTFQSEASDLTCGGRCQAAERDINLVSDIFRYDRVTGTIECISRGRGAWLEPSVGPAMDGIGDVIAFASRHPIDRLDDRQDYDLFVWTRRPDRQLQEAIRLNGTARGRPAGRDTASRTWTATGRR